MPESNFIRYVILLSVKPGQKPTEALIRDHVTHLKELDKAGKYVMGGPFQDHSGGMLIVKAGSLEEARRIAEADPSSGRATRPARSGPGSSPARRTTIWGWVEARSGAREYVLLAAILHLPPASAAKAAEAVPFVDIPAA